MEAYASGVWGTSQQDSSVQLIGIKSKMDKIYLMMDHIYAFRQNGDDNVEKKTLNHNWYSERTDCICCISLGSQDCDSDTLIPLVMIAAVMAGLIGFHINTSNFASRGEISREIDSLKIDVDGLDSSERRTLDRVIQKFKETNDWDMSVNKWGVVASIALIVLAPLAMIAAVAELPVLFLNCFVVTTLLGTAALVGALVDKKIVSPNMMDDLKHTYNNVFDYSYNAA